MRKAKKTKNKTKQKVGVRSLDMLIVCSYNTDYRRLKQENLVQVPCPCGCWQHQLILLILIRYKVVNYFMMSCRKYPYLPYRRDFSKTSSAPLEIPIKFPHHPRYLRLWREGGYFLELNDIQIHHRKGNVLEVTKDGIGCLQCCCRKYLSPSHGGLLQIPPSLWKCKNFDFLDPYIHWLVWILS